MKKKISGRTIKVRKKSSGPSGLTGDFESLVASIVQIHHQAQDFAAKAVNVGLTLRNWFIGRQIEVYERQGVDRATYGDKLMDTLAKRLVQQGWGRCERRELYRFRQFYVTYPKIVESLTPQLTNSGQTLLSRLSFTHFAELLEIQDSLKRVFYECARYLFMS